MAALAIAISARRRRSTTLVLAPIAAAAAASATIRTAAAIAIVMAAAAVAAARAASGSRAAAAAFVALRRAQTPQHEARQAFEVHEIAIAAASAGRLVELAATRLAKIRDGRIFGQHQLT